MQCHPGGDWHSGMGLASCICIYPPSTQTVLCARSHSYKTTVLDSSYFEVYIISSRFIHTCISVTQKFLNHGLKNLSGLQISGFLGVGIKTQLGLLILVVWNQTVAVMTCPSKKLNDMPRQLMGLKQTDSSQKYAPTYLAPNEVCDIFRRGPKIPATVIMVVPRLLTIDCLLETHSLLSCIVPPMISIGTLILLYQKKRNAEQGQKVFHDVPKTHTPLGRSSQ